MTTVKLLALEALQKYGNKCLAVLKTALRVTKRYDSLGVKRPGDFDYRSVVEELNKQGIKYNPSMMLRILERDYGILETVSHTLTHRWYKFIDKIAVEEAIAEFEGYEKIENFEIALIKIQIAALNISSLQHSLESLLKKHKLNSEDIKTFKTIAFKDLPLVVKLLKKSQRYENELAIEIEILQNVMKLAMLVASKISSAIITESEVFKEISESSKESRIEAFRLKILKE